MADAPINRVWISIDTGSQNFGPKRSFFAGGDSVDEVVAHLTDLVGAEGAENLIDVLTKIALLDPPDVQAVGNLRAGGVIKQDQPKQDSGAPLCNHGVMVKRKSKPGAAKSWEAWMCAAPQGAPDQCKPIWL